jgi:hypothetical protein
MEMMRRQALVVLVAAAGFAVPAVAKDLATSLKGNWVVDKLSAFEAAAPPLYKLATPEKQKEMRDQVLKGMPDMFIEFTADKATMKAGQETPQIATYKVTRQEKSTMWVELVPQGKTGPAAEAEKLSMEFVDDDTVKMLKEGEAAPVLLKRQK